MQDLRALLDAHGLFAKKNLGQNFLLDSGVTDRIAHAAMQKLGDLSRGRIIEIGPGPGGLTRSLLSAGAKDMVLIEKDERFFPLLEYTKSFYPDSQVTLENKDAVNVDYKQFGAGLKVVANLPYNVATPILLNFLHNVNTFSGFILMFQKEVAQRISAPDNTEFYGRLSIISQFLCEAEVLFDLPPTVFHPAPKVYSSIVYLRPREKPLYDVELSKLERITAVLFSQRRKMLRGILKQLGNPDEICEKAGIDGTMRPENLSIYDFTRIAQVIE